MPRFGFVVKLKMPWPAGFSPVRKLDHAVGVKAGIVEKSGSWYSYDGSRIGQGREAAKTFLTTNTDIAQSIEQAIRSAAGQIGQSLAHGDGEKADAEEE